MSNGQEWTDAHTAILMTWAGKEPASAIARRTGHNERTIRRQMQDRGLGPYLPRQSWTRRDYLLAGAAGLGLHAVERDGPASLGHDLG
jgi:hypothetical protein